MVPAMSLGVCIVTDGAPAPPLVADSLRRDAFEVDVLGGGLPAAPTAALILAFFAAGVEEASLTRLVRWRARAPTAALLLGCAPSGSGADCERALAAGFDDFVAGRQSPRELAGRLRALARSLEPGRATGRLLLGPMVLDAGGHDLRIAGRRVRLTRLESRALAALMRAPAHTLRRDQLLERIWGDRADDRSERSLDNLVQRLRRKLGDRRALVTLRGIGFRLETT